MKQPRSVYFWIPRILCILTILFVSMFALDAFQAEMSVTDQIKAFLIHLTPSFVLVLILLFAWKRDLIGGIFFILIGLLSMPWIYKHNFSMNHSVLMSIKIVLLLAGPFILVGGLFFYNYWRTRKRISH